MMEARVKTICGPDGTGYLTKIYLGRHLRLHLFWRGDQDQDCHDHPADFWTFPLVSYREALPDGTERTVKAFRLYRRRATFAHRVIGPVEPGRCIVTLVWWGKVKQAWGFHTSEGWEWWRTYLGVPMDEGDDS